MKYIQAPVPPQYWIKNVKFHCGECGEHFDVLLPHGNEIIKFVSDKDGDERWLPTYGEGGYLFLLQRLVPGYITNQAITMAISRNFEKEFLRFQEPSPAGGGYVFFVRPSCPKCSSVKLIIEAEKISASPQLSWLRYSDELTT